MGCTNIAKDEDCDVNAVTDCASSENIVYSVFKSSNHLKELGSRNGGKNI